MELENDPQVAAPAQATQRLGGNTGGVELELALDVGREPGLSRNAELLGVDAAQGPDGLHLTRSPRAWVRVGQWSTREGSIDRLRLRMTLSTRWDPVPRCDVASL